MGKPTSAPLPTTHKLFFTSTRKSVFISSSTVSASLLVTMVTKRAALAAVSGEPDMSIENERNYGNSSSVRWWSNWRVITVLTGWIESVTMLD